MLIALHKPYGVLSQFTPEVGSAWRTLADLGLPKAVYPVGRLDADSEGLLLLSDEREVVDRLLHPDRAHQREYWVQVERIPDETALRRLSAGVTIGAYRTLPCEAARLEPAPTVGPRVPPIRQRKTVPDCWLSLTLIEGKNRQVRKMTAAVGHPTLRLLRARIGRLELSALGLEPGKWVELDADQRLLALGK
ncbi:pseudouridine synthase [Nibricoccus sp. IMCC34717]|uniref:pseudouridine synthase n=1 Tax=Nibricoccus sp. IMCC34717 TaxID=3034021 RepID=UPI00384EEDDC